MQGEMRLDLSAKGTLGEERMAVGPSLHGGLHRRTEGVRPPLGRALVPKEDYGSALYMTQPFFPPIE